MFDSITEQELEAVKDKIGIEASKAINESQKFALGVAYYALDHLHAMKRRADSTEKTAADARADRT